MNLLQRLILAIGLLLVATNVLFPPRTLSHDVDRRINRAFILSKDFYKTDIVEKNEEVGNWARTWNSAVLDRDRYWALTIAGVLVTVALAALAGRRSPKVG